MTLLEECYPRAPEGDENDPLLHYFRHTSQGAYITFLCTDKGLNWKTADRVGIITMMGACIGSMALGYFSQWVSRR